MRNIFKKQRYIFIATLFLVLVFSATYFVKNRNTETLEKSLSQFGASGQQILTDFDKIPQLTPVEVASGFEVTDDMKEGIEIKFAGQEEPEKKEEEKTKIAFPSSLDKPFVVSLPGGKSISITDKNGTGNASLLGRDSKADPSVSLLKNEKAPTPEQLKNFIQYKSSDNRKSSYYAYQKDQAMGERKLKNWILYAKGNGKENESYGFENAKVAIDEDGNAKVFFDDGKEALNQQAIADVSQNLLERAQRAVMADAGTDILAKNSNAEPDFVVPHPYYIDKDGQLVDLKWTVDETGKTISVDFEVKAEQYPIALDPTLQFTAPGQSNTANTISGEASSYFGVAMIAGDFNADGRADLAIGAQFYSTNTGRVYIFYNDGSISTTASSADRIITGEAINNSFGRSLFASDLNNDGKTDLIVGAGVSGGKAYIFYNNGSNSNSAASASAIISTSSAEDSVGASFATGDFNADGKTDLAVGATGANANSGKVFIFYNANIGTKNVSAADVTISATLGWIYFGSTMATGDFNGDGKTDLAVAANGGENTGYVYIFYGGNISTKLATAADVIIAAEAANQRLSGLVSGDLNADGISDLAIGAPFNNSPWGRAYVFYGGSSLVSKDAAAADAIFSSDKDQMYFGASLTTGDFNADGKTDLAVGSNAQWTTGQAYIFYNGNISTKNASLADVIIKGENNYFGMTLTAGDFNGDGKIDLVVSNPEYSGTAGKVYIFYSQNGQINTNKKITGEASSYFGSAMIAGDFNADGKTDLAVGAPSYSTNTGRAYIFYNDGSISTTAATTDVAITGEATGDNLGYSMTAGDFNADGKTDLAVGAYGWGTFAGRAYIIYGSSSLNPTIAASAANVKIDGEASSDFGNAMTTGDFNVDGKADLAIGGRWNSSSIGRAYIIYGSSSLNPTIAASAVDVKINGEGAGIAPRFGSSMIAGDFNVDGKVDLAVGAFNSNDGRVYIFYGGALAANINAVDAPVKINGEAGSNLGYSLAAGDFNSDAKTDLAIGAINWNSSAGRAYIIYGSSSLNPTIAASAANVKIDGETATANNYFGSSLAAGDFNADGRVDLVVGAYGYFADNTGRAYIFYNDSSIPTTAATADVMITGEAGFNGRFGDSMTAGDFNSDGKVDLAVGSDYYSAGIGRVYIYETRSNYAWILQKNKTSPRISGAMGQEIGITGETSSQFGYSMTAGDFNADGKTDLAVGAYGWNAGIGRVYIFYNDGSISTTTASSDLIITGELVSNYNFGKSMTAGDFNADGKTDLAVGAPGYSLGVGRVYIFYNDGSNPTTAATADVIITGVADSGFGVTVVAGDLNADGKIDLVVGADTWSGGIGRVYIFYGSSGLSPTIAATAASVIITGDTAAAFGLFLTVGDFNADGKTDLAVGSYGYSAFHGRAYIFYGSAILPATITADAGANVRIDGEASSFFGTSLVSGDFNADGKTDLAVGATAGIGKAYIFYGGSLDANITALSNANVIITGEANGDNFGSLVAGDFNADGKTDLAVGARNCNGSIGRVYIFYGSVSLPATIAATVANIKIDGEATNNYFGYFMTAGDFNADGKTDLAVGAYGYSASSGKIYIYTNNESKSVGETATSSLFGNTLTTGDFNSDGKTDLAVGAPNYSSGSNTGRVYVFYNDGSIPTAAATADVVLTGEAAGNYFGSSMTTGDFNADGKTDLAVGAYMWSSTTGRAYVFLNANIATGNASGATIKIDGETSSNYYFGRSMTAGDFNANGKIDLAVGSYGDGSSGGRAYIFYDASIATKNASAANVIITGQTNGDNFSRSMTAGDLDADGKTDLVVGAGAYSSSTGRVYAFYGSASLTTPIAAVSAPIKIDGEATNNVFGVAMMTGDFNADSKTDLAVGASGYNGNIGRAYIFNNNNSGISATTASMANVTITGEASTNYFGSSMTAGDFNADGKTDLAVGAYGYSTSAGRAYIFYNDNGIRTATTGGEKSVMTIDAPVAGSAFGISLATGEFSNDGITDLVVGASGYSSSTGTFYIYPFEAGPNFQAPVSGRGKFKLRGKVIFK